MSGTLELFFVRHGQSTANADGVWQGQLEFPLSDLGREQARRAGTALTDKGPFYGVYTSPLTRASETAGIISRELGRAGMFSGEVSEIPGLSERYGGMLQGRPYEQTLRENPELIERLRSLPGEDAWSLAGAETDGDLMARFGGAVREIQERQTGVDSPRVVVVTHGGVLRAYLKAVFGDDVLPDNTRAPNASLTHVFLSTPNAEPELVELALTAHLAGL